jgi:predicted enzyme related to lactoylglutathione lyase
MSTPLLQDAPIYVYLPATDLRRARAFYEQTLGWKPRDVMRDDMGVSYGFADGTAAFLYPTPNAGTSKASQAFWTVADVDATIDELKRRGVAIDDFDTPGERSPSGAVINDGVKVAWFRDTEGNILAVSQAYP